MRIVVDLTTSRDHPRVLHISRHSYRYWRRRMFLVPFCGATGHGPLVQLAAQYLKEPTAWSCDQLRQRVTPFPALQVCQEGWSKEYQYDWHSVNPLIKTWGLIKNSFYDEGASNMSPCLERMDQGSHNGHSLLLLRWGLIGISVIPTLSLFVEPGLALRFLRSFNIPWRREAGGHPLRLFN